MIQISLEKRAGSRGECSWKHPFSLPSSHACKEGRSFTMSRGSAFLRD